MTVQLEQVSSLANKHSLGVQVWLFQELAPGQALQHAVQQHVSQASLHSQHSHGPGSPVGAHGRSQGWVLRAGRKGARVGGAQGRAWE